MPLPISFDSARSTMKLPTPGAILLNLWYQPRSRLKAMLADGGPAGQRETERQRLEMAAASERLEPLQPLDARPPLTLHILTGERFWYQTAFCLHSLARFVEPQKIAAEIYDDGSIDDDLARQIEAYGPLRLHRKREILERLDEHLPTARFPALRGLWERYPNIRKLTDPHAGSTGWKLVVDSDLLFFRRPDFLLTWQGAPDRILHAVDCEESYGYPRILLESLCGAVLPRLCNVGLTGLKSEDLDWDEIERWCVALAVKRNATYFLEQALIAMLVARANSEGRPPAVAPRNAYVTLPGEAEGVRPQAVMHHYVAGSKRWYFRNTWRMFASL